MKPLILEFIEAATEPDLDFSMIEYNYDLNLNVNKTTGLPAVQMPTLSTSTGTKIFDEVSDSDDSEALTMMATMTGTFTTTEGSDSDPRNFTHFTTMITMTTTRTMLESSDTD
ncbi:hypothetical protein [Flavobacterium subsaxonicum]|uniref:Uncharacterized protein n=1 Tax=Flavobacterium subsaxonicum WB 4.1-42 = DSM 21790 TaxID=1121898 RepID=A0A0A2MLM1_9FLAO|nr:hypothetical protein [Flavobacterium subsaxonicum]KGO93184.1 hypothetical protein Q766_07695 [Flavobacterium subsaxonicum WB 4.1-42 = DSM 21790]